MDPAFVKPNRHFSGQWGWTDGQVVIATLWIDEIQAPKGVPKWGMSVPERRDAVIRHSTALTAIRLIMPTPVVIQTRFDGKRVSGRKL